MCVYRLYFTYTPPDLVFDCLDDPGIVSLTKSLSGSEVIKGCLHLLLLKRHHGILHTAAITVPVSQGLSLRVIHKA